LTKKLKLIFIAIILLILMLSFGLTFVAPYAILQPPRISEPTTPKSLDLKSESLTVKSKEGHSLNGYWINSNQDSTRGVMILVHGVGGCKEHFLGLAQSLSKRGIASVLFDGRAHGRSEGDYCTYGFYEKEDISKIVDVLKSRNPELKIGIWGNSLGGAISLQALAFDKRIDFGIIESTFTDLNQIVFDYFNKAVKGFGIKILSDYSLRKAGRIAHFDPEKVKPIRSVNNINQSVLIAHGDMDENISYKYGQRLFNELKSSDKEFVLVEGGGHFDLFQKGGSEYKEKLMRFINRNLK